ncbi:methylmalonyl-CoA mutase family protein [Telluribacter sp.]|jgi:methylmalonyl-CoA mutase|uniref:methylmalonyl-CoA mutase family protein n=1 Tax=Telluribacter sp. TaxID=1978767 RepID=UPI002E113E0E|nr:methylmalonyl-CoA mutase family protein [Telluribacter sp.]
MNQPLFESFPSADKKAWKRQVEKDLKGTAYEELGWKLTESVAIEPYYTAAEVPDSQVNEIQVCQKQQPGWLTQSSIRFTAPTDTNQLIHKALAAGADAIWLYLGDAPLTPEDFRKTVNNVRLTDTPVVFELEGQWEALKKYLHQNAGYHLKGGVAADPLSNWMQTGEGYSSEMEQLREVLGLTREMPDFRPLMVSSQAYHEAGGSLIQELAFSLAAAVEYLDRLTEAGLKVPEVTKGLFFSFSIGTDYLSEIARLRAFRYLYRRVLTAYQLPDEPAQPYVHARNSGFYDATATPHTNMLRATSEAMSAALGGCDALTIHAYDATFRQPSDFSERIARNVSLILKEEGYLDKVADPAAGSYYLEVLTHRMAEAAWDLFLEVEKQGGLVRAFEQGVIQSEIQKVWQARQEAVQNGKVIVGVTKYRTEDSPEEKSPRVPVQPVQGGNKLTLLPRYQLSEAWVKQTI